MHENPAPPVIEPDHRPALHRRMVARWRLGRRDRLSAALARAHGTAELLADAELIVDLTWAPSRACAVCSPARPSHAAPTGTCLVDSLVVAGRDPDTTGRAVDLLWGTLHRNGHRPVHWNAPSVQHTIQVHELRAWSNARGRTLDEVSALVRAARRAAQDALERTRHRAAGLA